MKLKVWFDSALVSNVNALNIQCSDCRLKDYGLSSGSDLSPSVQSNPIETYIYLVKRDINELKETNQDQYFLHPNMTITDMSALNELTHNHTITIKCADKGGAVLIWDTASYISELGDNCQILRCTEFG